MDETLKQKLQKLIEYQKKDIELRKLNAFINSDEALLIKNKQKRMFNDAKQALVDCEKQAAALLDAYTELKRYIDENDAMFTELENAEAQSEDELVERVKKLESLKSKFQNADKKSRDIDEKSKEVRQTRVSAIKNGNAAKQRYNEASAKHNELLESKADELNKLNTELAALRKELDEKIFDEYKKLVDENKFPPVVPARGDDKKGLYNCGGCGINLPQQGNALLKDKGWCRCDNCRRIIVKLS